ncbi:MAG: hypothetical protein M3Y28_01545 [Armatimonadota bacterium]|nr:hypothetical protein [Armatimonadota bacterium]
MRTTRFFTIIAIFALVAGAHAKDDKKPTGPDWAKGMLLGKVVDAANSKPISGATVALQDRKGKVLAWTRTDAEGRYAIAADPLTVLHLRPSRRKGLLARLAQGTGRVVGAVVAVPLNAAKGIAQTLNPINTIKSAAVSAAMGNPMPLGANLVGGIVGGVSGAVKNSPKKMRETGANAAVNGGPAPKKKAADKPDKGEIGVRVIAPGYQEGSGTAGAYWIEAAGVTTDGKPVGPQAYLDTVTLGPVGTDKKSAIPNLSVTLTDGRLDPVLAPAGSSVQLSVKIQQPSDPPMALRVFAREDSTRRVVELQPNALGVYGGQMPLDPNMKPGDTTITIAGLHAIPVEVGLGSDRDDPLFQFASQLDDLNADKTYEYDPRIMASENRIDLKLTVLDPSQAIPSIPNTKGTDTIPTILH